MTDTVEEVAVLSDDVDAGEVDAEDDGTVSPTPATVPKKRGRPSNPEKPKKVVASTPGRGRGRPKATEGVNKVPEKSATSAAEGSDEEDGTESDEISLVFNGDSADVGGTSVPSKRGRKPKAKRKLTHSIEATGKGRGRPKKVAKTDVGEDDEAADDDDIATNDYKAGKKAATKGAKKGRGRPRKVNNSDDESSDDKEERRAAGRPSSGGINLNIVHTGRGQGRPKKSTTAGRPAKSPKTDEIKQRGRPTTSGKGPYVPTGKPRGRPKVVNDEDSQKEDREAENSSTIVDENSDDNGVESDKINGE